MQKKSENSTKRTDAPRTIEDFLKEVLPHKVVFLDENPNLAINFLDIQECYSDQDATIVLRGFLLGGIEAVNLGSKTIASTTFSSLPSAIDHINYIEGSFPSSLNGDIEFGDIPAKVVEYGKFTFKSQNLWSFEIHEHLTKKILSLESNEIITLCIDFKQTGAISIPKQIFIYIENDKQRGILLSAECEGQFYRGMNSRLLKHVRNFITMNFGLYDQQYNHTITEELYAIISESLTGSIPFPKIPSQYEQFTREAQQQIHTYLAQLTFSTEDIDVLLESKKYQYPEIQAAPTKEIAKPSLNIFRKKGKKGWEIIMGDEKVELYKSKGCVFLLELLRHPDGYTPYELEDKFDPILISNDNIPRTTRAEDRSGKQPSATTRIDQKAVNKYKSEKKRLEKEIDDLNKELEATQDIEDTILLRERIQQIQEEIKHYTSEIHNAYGDDSQIAKSIKQKRDRVNKAIKRTIATIGVQNKHLGKYFSSSIVKNDGPYPDGQYMKWVHRPSKPTHWILE